MAILNEKIQHFMVLMLENRSFDHLLGYLKARDPRVAGLRGDESNYQDPNLFQLQKIPVTRATSYVMSFDPGHEFDDVQLQLYGPNKNPPPVSNPVSDPAPMVGFVRSASSAARQANVLSEAVRIMECFQPDQLRVISALAQEFSLFNFWHSSLPGPTWPNRFFVHTGTSGGLTDSPDSLQVVTGFSFINGTIYERLNQAGKDWRIYHDGLPQSAGIDSLRLEYIDPFTKHFREMKFFEEDMKRSSLPEYVFIEPYYDTGHNYSRGNSMHPLNDIRKGERLVKLVYETLRKSDYWDKTMLVIVFDEHGGFYDHVPPPKTAPTQDDTRYASRPFAFDRLGLRVPAIVVSAYTQRGTVIGTDPADHATTFDHTSILATVECRFGLAHLTGRDLVAQTLDVALNLATPRLSLDSAPEVLPDPLKDSLVRRFINFFSKRPTATSAKAPLSKNQISHLALAMVCDLAVTHSSEHDAIWSRHSAINNQKMAAKYIREVEYKIHSRRSY